MVNSKRNTATKGNNKSIDPTKGLTLEKITSFEKFLSLESEWNGLLSQGDCDCVFLRHEWFRVWWQCFGQQKKLLILLVREAGKLIGIAPLMQVREKRGELRFLPARLIRFVENDESPRVDFIIQKNRLDAIQCILKYLAKMHKEWDIILLRNLLAGSNFFKIVSGKSRINDLQFGIKDSCNSPFLCPNTEWESFFFSKSKHFQGVFKYNRNKIRQLGNVSIKNINQYPHGLQMLPQVCQIGQKSWKHCIKRSIASTDANKKFCLELTSIANQRGWLNLWLLQVDNRPVAFEYHLNYKNKIHALRSEFDEDYRAYSPGTVLDSYIVENIFKSEALEYDMGGGETFYKKRWTTNVKQYKEVFIYNNHLYSKILRALEFRLISHLSRLQLLQAVKYRLFQRARRIYQERGLLGLIKRGFTKFCAIIYSSNHAIWFKRDLNDKIFEHNPKIDLKIHVNKWQSTLQWIKSLGQEWMYDPKEIEIAEKENHYFPSVHHSGEIIGYLKVGFDKVYIQDFERVTKFKPKTAFIYDTYVLPEFRGLGVAQFLITECMKFLKNNDYNRLLCHIPPWNSASIQAYSKIGFRPVKKIRVFKVLGLTFSSFNPEHL